MKRLSWWVTRSDMTAITEPRGFVAVVVIVSLTTKQLHDTGPLISTGTAVAQCYDSSGLTEQA